MRTRRCALGSGKGPVSILLLIFLLLKANVGAADPLSPDLSQPTSGESSSSAAVPENSSGKSGPASSKTKKIQRSKTSGRPNGLSLQKPSGVTGNSTGATQTKTKKERKKSSLPPLSRNGPDALAAYRHTWNPITGGPEFLPIADTLPEGELNGRMFFYSRFTDAQYTASGGIQGLPSGFYQTQLLLLGAVYYGLTTNDELVLLPSLISTFSSSNGQNLYGTGLNDFTFGIKHRWVIQDPNSWRPSIATPFLITLPTTTWLGTPVPKGGLPPLSVVPSTHFGSYALTTGLFIRKNVKPFRLYSDFFYTFNVPTNGVLPGKTAEQQIQYGDLAQYRFGVEDVFNDETGFGALLEFVGLSGLPFSIDGIGPSVTPTNFNLMGLQPTIEYNLTSRLMFS